MKGLSGITVWGIALSCAAAALWLTGTGPAKAEEGTPKPGGTFKDCAQCPEMVVIPGGTFLMGSPPVEPGHRKPEGPQHRVTVRRFAMGRYEVTFAEWDACTAVRQCRRRPKDFGWGRGRRPVFDVSWDDAKWYVAWLNRKIGKMRYRLPSEAEWEYAARAGTKTAYYWGAQATHQYANYGSSDTKVRVGPRGEVSGRDRWYRTSPVGSFPPNRFGLYDVLGNVEEWVEDCWHESYAAPSDGRAWTTRIDCRRRVIRGGSWRSHPLKLRSATRYAAQTNDRRTLFGFRVARTLP